MAQNRGFRFIHFYLYAGYLSDAASDSDDMV
jgi:hypothetical protein